MSLIAIAIFGAVVSAAAIAWTWHERKREAQRLPHQKVLPLAPPEDAEDRHQDGRVAMSAPR